MQVKKLKTTPLKYFSRIFDRNNLFMENNKIYKVSHVRNIKLMKFLIFVTVIRFRFFLQLVLLLLQYLRPVQELTGFRFNIGRQFSQQLLLHHPPVYYTFVQVVPLEPRQVLDVPNAVVLFGALPRAHLFIVHRRGNFLRDGLPLKFHPSLGIPVGRVFPLSLFSFFKHNKLIIENTIIRRNVQ